MRRFSTLLAGLMLMAGGVRADTVRIARQFGLSYLPLIVMQDGHLIEQEAATRGIELSVEWTTFTGGPPINDALISGNIDLASGGVGPLLTIWSRTRGGADGKSLGVKGVTALGNMPMWLMTRDPGVQTIADFSEKDRIALPGVKVSVQAVVLQMAAEQAFGPGQQYRLDPLTVSMGHPDAMTALLGGGTGVTAHFTAAPYMYEEEGSAGVHRVLNSYEVLGGPHTFNAVWTTRRFYESHPLVIAAFMAGLERAMSLIRQRPEEAAAIWVRIEKPKLTPAQAAEMIRRPENEWTTMPKRVMSFLSFMHATGAIKEDADNWHQVFFPSAHGAGGG